MSPLHFLMSLGAFSLCLWKVADAQEFTSPAVNTNRYVNRSEAITFEWNYNLGQNALQYSFQCGYRGTTPNWVIIKVGNAAPTVQQNFQSRAEVTNTVGNTIGFRLRNCQFADAGNVGCQMVIAGQTYFSNYYRFQIYERPKFINCLGIIGTVFQINEGQPINSTCTYYGAPAPSSRCVLLDVNGQELSATPTVATNYTVLNPMVILNVQRAAKTVRCRISHLQTGYVDQIRQVLVYHVPSAPVDLIRTKSSENSITVNWGTPRETGNRPIITYFLETETPSGFRNGTNYTALANSIKYEHTFHYLQPKLKYTIRVSAFNLVGRGIEAMQTFETIAYVRPDSSARATSSSNTGLIVGLVIAGIVILCIIVVLVVCFYKRRAAPEKYPTSFVEEAVDYPPADPSMYSRVNKKEQIPMQEQNSTSGYPDIIHQAKGKTNGNQPEQQSLRTGPGNSTSASYEDSKKEYV